MPPLRLMNFLIDSSSGLLAAAYLNARAHLLRRLSSTWGAYAAHPTDARLTHRAIEKLVDLAKREGVELRQSYLRVAKRAAIMVGRYTHAHQFKRARRQLKFLHTRLGRIIRDIRRKIEGNTALEDRFC